MDYDITNGEKTLYAIDQSKSNLFSFDVFEIDPQQLDKSYEILKRIASENCFAEGIKERLRVLGYVECTKDSLSIAKVITDLCKKKSIVDDTGKILLSRQTIKNWIDKKPPIDSVQSRDNVYALCFALSMNEKETASFFFKKYMARPFNFRNPKECIYYYCLKTGKPYLYVDRIYNHFLDLGDTGDTIILSNELKDVQDEDELMEFFERNLLFFPHSDGSGRKKCLEYLEKCKEIVKKCEINEEDFEISSGIHDKKKKSDATKRTISDNDLLRKIYDTEYEYIQKKKNSNLIIRHLPGSQEFVQIRAGSASSEVIRRTLILLIFYYYFQSEQEPYTDEFLETLRTELSRCGFEGYYARNVYDFIFIACARNDYPLIAFQTLIHGYLDEKNDKKK